MKKAIRIVLVVVLMLVSCDEPVTVVTNYVHADGSITRKIEMRSTKKTFEKSDILVPFGSSWTVKDTIVIGAKNDTTWIKIAEKTFRNAEEINLSYRNDSGPNRGFAKRADFKRSFKWFHTEYRFCESFDKRLSFGYPVKDFLNDEELLYFYSPEELKQSKLNGPDSLRFKLLADSVDRKTDRWMIKSLISGWADEFASLTGDKGDRTISRKSLKSLEDSLTTMIMQRPEYFDSLWNEGSSLKLAIGESNAMKYRSEADTAMSHAIDKLAIDFKNYSVRIDMPGRLTGTNGFIDSSKVLLWPVTADYFLTQDYQMWAESKVPNAWAWIISIVFVLFVLTGITLRVIKKG